MSGQLTIDEVEIFDCALSEAEIDLIHDANSGGKCHADLGDAPDSTNHRNTSGMPPMMAYPGVPAHYPTVYDPALGPPYGPIHHNPKGLAWLGRDVSIENEADTGWDRDLTNNINPSLDMADLDGFDDGVSLGVPFWPYHPSGGSETLFLYTVYAIQATTLYINVWFDYNRDGDWEDSFKFAIGPTVDGVAQEWAVQNERIMVAPPAAVLDTPGFWAFCPPNQNRDDPMWMRITLTDGPIAPANGADGSGPLGGYLFGETEDYLLTGSKKAVADICVSKFNDLNGNGVKDSNEPPLFGWKFDVKDAAGTLMGTIATMKDLPSCLTVPAPGIYTITEQVQSNWTPTTTNPQTVTVQPGQTVNLKFGNKATGQGQICVSKFNDLNGNGVQDTGEANLYGWTFEIKDVSGNVVATLTTVPPGPAGSPCPGGGNPPIVPAPGYYTITEQIQSNWTPTTANPQTVTVQPGQTVNVQFGNKATGQGQICVSKFNDINGNGVKDSGEPPLFGWKFDVKDVAGTLMGTITTMKDLPSCLTVPAPGTYTITEQVKPSWTPTTTNPQTVTVQPGQTVNLTFGNKAI